MNVEQELQEIPQTPTYVSEDAGKEEVMNGEGEDEGEDNIGSDEGKVYKTVYTWTKPTTFFVFELQKRCS